MANVINGTSTGSGGLITSGDDSGILNIQTNETTAMSIDASQSVDFTNNIDAPNTFGFKNRIINGGMVIDQRNAGASVTGNDGVYTLDRTFVIATQSSKFTVQQNAGSVTPPDGFRNYLGVTSSSAYSLLSGDYFTLCQRIEGFNTADMMFGTANAATFTLSFWVRSSLTGTFGGLLANHAADRCYLYSYTINAANTWEKKTITVAGDTTGTWATNNTRGLQVMFCLGAGSSYVGATGSWSSTYALGPTGQTNVLGTNGATFYITGVQLEKGTQATSFDFRSYGTELALCQRYFAKTYNTGVVPGTATVAGAIASNAYSVSSYASSGTWCFPVAMRAEPTVTLYSTQNANTTGVSTADATDGAATTICLGLSAVSIRRNNNSSGVGSGSDMKSQVTASAEL